jgi:hypothetical protein
VNLADGLVSLFRGTFDFLVRTGDLFSSMAGLSLSIAKTHDDARI